MARQHWKNLRKQSWTHGRYLSHGNLSNHKAAKPSIDDRSRSVSGQQLPSWISLWTTCFVKCKNFLLAIQWWSIPRCWWHRNSWPNRWEICFFTWREQNWFTGNLQYIALILFYFIFCSKSIGHQLWHLGPSICHCTSCPPPAYSNLSHLLHILHELLEG